MTIGMDCFYTQCVHTGRFKNLLRLQPHSLWGTHFQIPPPLEHFTSGTTQSQREEEEKGVAMIAETDRKLLVSDRYSPDWYVRQMNLIFFIYTSLCCVYVSARHSGHPMCSWAAASRWSFLMQIKIQLAFILESLPRGTRKNR
jgi:hypothetical protein